MLACILFVFGALVEYAVILFRKQTYKDDDRQAVSNGRGDTDWAAQKPLFLQYQNVVLHNSGQHHLQQQPHSNNHHSFHLPPRPHPCQRQPSQQQLVMQQQQQQKPPLQQPQPQRVRIICNENNLHYEISTAAAGGAATATTASPPAAPGAPSPRHPRQPPPPPPRASRAGNSHNDAAAALQHQQEQQHLFDNLCLMQEGEERVVGNGATSSRRFDVCGENYLHVDRFFLVAMPMLFLVFNVVYWMSYGRHFFMESVEDLTEKY
jgi:hypothetical protein